MRLLGWNLAGNYRSALRECQPATWDRNAGRHRRMFRFTRRSRLAGVSHGLCKAIEAIANACVNGQVASKPAIRLIRLELLGACRQLSQMAAALVRSHSGCCPARAWDAVMGFYSCPRCCRIAIKRPVRSYRSERLKRVAARASSASNEVFSFDPDIARRPRPPRSIGPPATATMCCARRRAPQRRLPGSPLGSAPDATTRARPCGLTAGLSTGYLPVSTSACSVVGCALHVPHSGALSQIVPKSWLE